MGLRIDGLGTCGAVLLYKLLNVPAEEAGKILGDYLRYFRVKNLERLHQKHCDIKRKRGLTDDLLRPVPPNVGVPLLEAASLETHESLQEIWARLLTNATDPNFKEEIRVAFISIIKELSCTDVMLLNLMMAKFSVPSSEPYYRRSNFAAELGVDWGNFKISLDNLERLNLVDTLQSIHVPATSSIGELRLRRDPLAGLRTRINSQGEHKKSKGAVSLAFLLNKKEEMQVETADALKRGEPEFTALGLAFARACVAEPTDHEGIDKPSASGINDQE